MVHESKSSVVREHRPTTIIEMYDDPVMGPVVGLAAVRAQEGPAAGHTEVAHPGGVAVEPDEQVLRASLDGLDQSAMQ